MADSGPVQPHAPMCHEKHRQNEPGAKGHLRNGHEPNIAKHSQTRAERMGHEPMSRAYLLREEVFSLVQTSKSKPLLISSRSLLKLLYSSYYCSFSEAFYSTSLLCSSWPGLVSLSIPLPHSSSPLLSFSDQISFAFFCPLVLFLSFLCHTTGHFTSKLPGIACLQASFVFQCLASDIFRRKAKKDSVYIFPTGKRQTPLTARRQAATAP